MIFSIYNNLIIYYLCIIQHKKIINMCFDIHNYYLLCVAIYPIICIFVLSEIQNEYHGKGLYLI
jgi:hypothetical protein